jgi:hypothetical protein
VAEERGREGLSAGRSEVGGAEEVDTHNLGPWI